MGFLARGANLLLVSGIQDVEMFKKKRPSPSIPQRSLDCVIGGTIRGSENKQIESRLSVGSRGSKKIGLNFHSPRCSMNVWYILPTFGPPKSYPSFGTVIGGQPYIEHLGMNLGLKLCVWMMWVGVIGEFPLISACTTWDGAETL